MVEALVAGDDVEEVPDLHGRSVEAGHGRRRHLLPVPSRRRQIRVRRVEAPHPLRTVPLLHLHSGPERKGLRQRR